VPKGVYKRTEEHHIALKIAQNRPEVRAKRSISAKKSHNQLDVIEKHRNAARF
jgi:hypothetical protein